MPLLLFLAWPLAEIAGFIMVGRAIGVLPTLVLTIAISALGLALLREAGAATIARLQQGVRAPGVILAQGGIRMGAGLLLLIPGFVTDVAAVALLLFGGGRAMVGGNGATPPQFTNAQSQFTSAGAQFTNAGAQFTNSPPGAGSAIDPSAIDGATIEGDFRRVDN